MDTYTKPLSNRVTLRAVTVGDLPILFEHQQEPEANQMAGFPARDRPAFMAHWTKVLGNPTNITQSILVDGHVAGNIGSWEQDSEREIGYWLGKEYWGMGIATAALHIFLGQLDMRPLYAHVVKHNIASLRVLQKCGFAICSEDDEEYMLQLSAPA